MFLRVRCFMDAIGYMDSCKEKLGISTNYELWKATDIPQARLSDYYKGNRVPDEYACFKFAEILEMSPAIVIAEIQASNMKKPDKALFFKSFLTAVGLWIILAVIPVNYGTFSNNAQAAGNRASIELKSTLYEPLFYFWRGILAVFCRYFTCNWTRKVLHA